jgi:tyrosinase
MTVLFEQILYDHMLACVAEFPEGKLRDRYARAAKHVRHPYWDWALDPQEGSVLPDIVQQPTIEVIKPEGPATIDNPLYSYNFHPVSSEGMYFHPVSRSALAPSMIPFFQAADKCVLLSLSF